MTIDLPIQIIPNWHAVIVHFPVALLITATGLCIAARIAGDRPLGCDLYKAARWNLWVGVLAAVFAVGTGWYAYQSVNHDEAGHAAMTIHMKWALLTLTISLITAFFTGFGRNSKIRPTPLVIALFLASALFVSITGYLGGENVFRHGIGVMHMPEAEEDEDQSQTNDHHHHHNDDEPNHGHDHETGEKP